LRRGPNRVHASMRDDGAMPVTARPALPLTQRDPGMEPSSPAKPEEGEPSHLRVLVIDDDKFLAETIAESLSRVGYECSIAATGSQGAERIEHEDFDVILTDLKMND